MLSIEASRPVRPQLHRSPPTRVKVITSVGTPGGHGQNTQQYHQIERSEASAPTGELERIPSAITADSRPILDPIPLWFLLLLIAILCLGGLRLVAATAKQGWRITRYAIAPGSHWIVRVAKIAGFAFIVGTGTFFIARWVQARPWTQDPWTAGVRPAIREPNFKGGKKGHAEFVKHIIPLLRRHGLTHEQAVLFAAHVARESGWGRAVFQNNFGNIKTGKGWKGSYFWLTDRYGYRDKYRAWDSEDRGIEQSISLIRDSKRYRHAWRLLRAGKVAWYGQLGLDGYYEAPSRAAGSVRHLVHNKISVRAPQHEYESIVRLVRYYERTPVRGSWENIRYLLSRK